MTTLRLSLAAVLAMLVIGLSAAVLLVAAAAAKTMTAPTTESTRTKTAAHEATHKGILSMLPSMRSNGDPPSPSSARNALDDNIDNGDGADDDDLSSLRDRIAHVHDWMTSVSALLAVDRVVEHAQLVSRLDTVPRAPATSIASVAAHMLGIVELERQRVAEYRDHLRALTHRTLPLLRELDQVLHGGGDGDGDGDNDEVQRQEGSLRDGQQWQQRHEQQGMQHEEQDEPSPRASSPADVWMRTIDRVRSWWQRVTVHTNTWVCERVLARMPAEWLRRVRSAKGSLMNRLCGGLLDDSTRSSSTASTSPSDQEEEHVGAGLHVASRLRVQLPQRSELGDDNGGVTHVRETPSSLWLLFEFGSNDVPERAHERSESWVNLTLSSSARMPHSARASSVSSLNDDDGDGDDDSRIEAQLLDHLDAMLQAEHADHRVHDLLVPTLPARMGSDRRDEGGAHAITSRLSARIVRTRARKDRSDVRSNVDSDAREGDGYKGDRDVEEETSAAVLLRGALDEASRAHDAGTDTGAAGTAGATSDIVLSLSTWRHAVEQSSSAYRAMFEELELVLHAIDRVGSSIETTESVEPTEIGPL